MFSLLSKELISIVLFLVVLCCLFFGVSVSVTFYHTCVHIIFSSVSVAWEIAAHSVDHMFSLYFAFFVILIISRFGF